jgi:hypothetical protein
MSGEINKNRIARDRDEEEAGQSTAKKWRRYYEKVNFYVYVCGNEFSYFIEQSGAGTDGV